MTNIKKNENGMILVTLIVLMTAFAIIGLALTSYTTTQYSQTRNNLFAANALQVAEAGIEQSLDQINQNEAFAGYTTEQTFFNNSNQGRGVFTTVVSPTADSNAKVITSTAKVFRTATAIKPVSTKKVKVTIVGTNSQGYSVQAGPGGLTLGGAASINNSDVYINGKLTLTGAARIGTLVQPVNVNVANAACPTGNNPGPTYAQVCGTANPISLDWSTFIYGTVCATGQTNKGPAIPFGNILTGLGGQGLKNGCVAPPLSQTPYDKPAQVSAVSTTGAGNSNTYVCNSWPFNRTWPANLKLTGNVNVGGACILVIKGDTYITGDLVLDGAAVVIVDNSVGTRRPNILVDGKITVTGAASILSNLSGTGVNFISMKASAACNPNCTALSGNELKTSQGVETVSVAGGVNLAGMSFNAQWGKLTIGGAGSVGTAQGQTIDMSGAGSIIFGTVLSSGSRSWSVTSYQQL